MIPFFAKIAIAGATLVNLEGGSPLTHAVVVIEGERIRAIEENDGTTATVRELEYYVEAGMTPLAALRSATVEAASLLGVEKEIGTIEASKYADLIAVRSDPTKSVSALREIVLVMKGGEVVLDRSLDHR